MQSPLLLIMPYRKYLIFKSWALGTSLIFYLKIEPTRSLFAILPYRIPKILARMILMDCLDRGKPSIRPYTASGNKGQWRVRKKDPGYTNDMNQTWMSIMRFIFLLFLLPTLVQGQDITGVGDNYGGGFTPDGKGGWIGWGNRYGQDWRSDGQGGLDGAGKNYGQSYRADGQGGLQGGGNAWGKDWRNDQGWLIGSGNNFGKAWRPDSQGGYDGMAKDYGQGWRKSPGDQP